MTTQKISRFHRAALALVLPVAVIGALAACDDSAAPQAAPAASPEAAVPSTSTSAAPAAGLHMITNSGHQLAFHVTPGSSPTIVLDAGGGEDSSYWDALVPQLSQATGSQIITYDRAGMGASEEVQGPWDPQAAASDLQAGLRELGVTQNVVLAGHSQAGEVAHYFVLANPGVVSGAVLIDANVPQFFTDTQIQRIVTLTAPQIEELKKAPSTKANRQLIATADNFGPTHQAYHKVSWPDSVPVTYIVSDKTPFDGSPQDAQAWRDAAAAFVKAGPDHTLVAAKGSSHDVPQDNPVLVLNEIAQMTATVK
ncbi:alpha/beta fold hydrolase [Micromonospora haikouensis]|uniref:alpha/beta fold hydrolase n=1 Tax=Micromonospora haikouensis TaxID=686309 RepID=UPI000B832A09|nr:alpha/beta hydrolase [Micromonospora haikouensis]